MAVRESAHLIPGNVWIFAWFHIVVDVRAEDFLTLAEFRLLPASHVRVVAQVGFVLGHSKGHGHLHAVGGVSVIRVQTYLITFVILLFLHDGVISVNNTFKHYNKCKSRFDVIVSAISQRTSG